MADPLSFSSGIFAVVGLADVVLRARRVCYQFLNAIKDAPSEVQRLRCCVEEISFLVENSRQYCKELRRSLLSALLSTTALSQGGSLLSAALRAVNHEFSALETLAKRHGKIAIL